MSERELNDAYGLIADLRKRIEALERALRMAQAFVDAPTKFGIRHKAYTQMRRALDAALRGEETHDERRAPPGAL
jgi:hypothetical protein